MTRRFLVLASLAVALAEAGTRPAAAQSPSPQTAPAVKIAAPVPAAPSVVPRWARVSFFVQGATSAAEGEASTMFSEVVTTLAAESAHRQDGGFQYGLNLRFGAYPSSEDRAQRVSIYDAFVAQGFRDGRLLVKGGQMWLNDFGGLGAVAGGLVEMRQGGRTSGLRWRAGGFGGVEPKIMEAGYVPGITKFGGYVALDGEGARKHVVGYVAIRNEHLTERSVLTFTNYVPAGRAFFLYQAAEVDVSGPAGQGPGGLAYFFVNAHGSPAKVLDVQVTYHRGHSSDDTNLSA